MFSNQSLILLLGLALALGTSCPAESVVPGERHRWKRIEYPSLEVPGTSGEKMDVLISSGFGEEVQRLRFSLLWTGKRDQPLPPALADASRISVQLHRQNGDVVQPDGDRPLSWNGAGLRGITYSLDAFYPWQANSLEDTWIELNVAGERYWIELPYGFVRDPADTRLPEDPAFGLPAIAPAMRDWTDHDCMVPWQHVEYDLGVIQNGWRLTVLLSNPFDARAEAILYRDDREADGSFHFWELETPRTSMEIRRSDDSALIGKQTGIRLHQDGMRRSDQFEFNRDGSPAIGRNWGTAVIFVDEKSYAFQIPSSLFKYTHGAVQSGKHRQIPRP